MQRFGKWIVLMSFLTGLSACGGQKGARLQTSVVPPDKTLYQSGNEFLEKSQFTQARLAYQTLIRTYPGSELEPEAYFAMAESFRKEGGIENSLLAEDQYRNFIIFFPTHARAPEAQMKIIALLMRQMRSPDRDQKETERAEAEIQNFLTRWPSNDFAPVVRQFLDEVRENLAMHDLVIGDFYARIGSYNGALSRYKEVTDKYPQFSRMDEIDYKVAQMQLAIADVLQKLEQVAEAENYRKEAATYLGRVVEGYPFSKYFEPSKANLTKMGKPIPEVNQELAEKNLALVRLPDPFSPLKPFVSLAEAMGFIGPPDPFARATKAVADSKAAAESSPAVVPQGLKPGDVTITGTITKGADGKPVTNPNVTPAKTDKKDDKTVDDKTKAIKK